MLSAAFSSSRTPTAGPAAHSVAALVQRAADGRQLNLNHLKAKAKAKRLEREDKIMQSISSRSAAVINVGYYLDMRQLQSELTRERTYLRTATDKTGRQYRTHRQRAWGLSEDIEERQIFLTKVHFVQDHQWCQLYTEEYKLERQKYRQTGERPPTPLHVRCDVLRFLYSYLMEANLPLR